MEDLQVGLERVIDWSGSFVIDTQSHRRQSWPGSWFLTNYSMKGQRWEVITSHVLWGKCDITLWPSLIMLQSLFPQSLFQGAEPRRIYWINRTPSRYDITLHSSPSSCRRIVLVPVPYPIAVTVAGRGTVGVFMAVIWAANMSSPLADF